MKVCRSPTQWGGYAPKSRDLWCLWWERHSNLPWPCPISWIPVLTSYWVQWGWLGCWRSVQLPGHIRITYSPAHTTVLQMLKDLSKIVHTRASGKEPNFKAYSAAGVYSAAMNGSSHLGKRKITVALALCESQMSTDLVKAMLSGKPSSPT